MIKQTLYILLVLTIIRCSNENVEKERTVDLIQQAHTNEPVKMNADDIIFSGQLNFRSDYNESLVNEIKDAFSGKPRKIWVRDNRVTCQIQISKHGYNFLTYLADEFLKDRQVENRGEVYNGLLTKRAEYWKRVNDIPTVFPEPIDPKIVKEYADYLVSKLEKIDKSKYVWQVWSDFHHPEDNYKGKYCRFTTYNTNPTYPEYDETKKDHCLVSTVNGGEFVEWIKLTDKMIIKGDRIELEARKIYMDKVMYETAKEIIKLCDLALKYNLKINRVSSND